MLIMFFPEKNIILITLQNTCIYVFVQKDIHAFPLCCYRKSNYADSFETEKHIGIIIMSLGNRSKMLLNTVGKISILYYSVQLFVSCKQIFNLSYQVHIAVLQLHTFKTSWQRSIVTLKWAFIRLYLKYHLFNGEILIGSIIYLKLYAVLCTVLSFMRNVFH